MKTLIMKCKANELISIIRDIKDNCTLRNTYAIVDEIESAYKKPIILNKMSKIKQENLKEIIIYID